MPVSMFSRQRLLLLLALFAQQGLAGEAPALSAAIDASVDREHAAGRFDGVVFVGRGDATLYQRAVGEADRQHHVPHRVDEPWRLASVSKQVAALLVMQQIERGSLTLETTLHDALPGFGSPVAGRVTIRQLLQHTSGLPNPDATLPPDASADTMPAYYTRPMLPGEKAVDVAQRFCAGKASGEPGERFSYNNCDTLMLQAILERATSRPYERLLADSVTTPLGLASWRMTLAPGVPPETPMGYLDAQRIEPAYNLANFGASGALIGSAPDLWRFDQASMTHRLLGDAATRTMWTGDPKLGYVALGAWSFPAALSGCRGPVQLVERRGEIGGVQVRNLMAPELKAALIVTSNTSQTEFGEIWQGRGWLHELASAAFCTIG